MRKVILLGLDCGNPFLIRQWIDELPNLRALVSNGYFAVLRSSVPSLTVPGWACMFSGKNPGKLGMYDFIRIPHYAKGGLNACDYRDSQSPYLWDFISNKGGRANILNVPGTFPPSKLRGIMISGGLTTPFYKNAAYTFPPELKHEINQVASGYDVLPFTEMTIRGKEEEYLEKIHINISKQISVVEHLMTRYEWDFMAQVFFVTDSVQHYFWHHLDTSHSWQGLASSKKWSSAIKSVYVHIDDGIGRIVRSAPKDCNIFVVSDHGCGPQLGTFMVNEWLARLGLLEYNVSLARRGRFSERALGMVSDLALRRYSRLVESIVPLLPRRLTYRFLLRGREKSSYSQVVASIRWKRTLAYGMGSTGGIYVNLKGREPEGIVNPTEYEEIRSRLIEYLQELKGPNGIDPMPVQSFRKEELYSGQFVSAAPDVVFIIDDYKYPQRVDVGGRQIWETSKYSGGHSRNGLFIASGPDIRHSSLGNQEFDICDIAPTILHLMGLPIPRDMDGQVLQSIMDSSSSVSQTAPTYADYDIGMATQQSKLTEDEEAIIRSRLEKLGYL